MILDNHRITIREVADDVGLFFGSLQAIFTDILGMKCAAAKIVPVLLNFEQKQCRMDIAEEMLMNSTTIQTNLNKSTLATYMYNCKIF